MNKKRYGRRVYLFWNTIILVTPTHPYVNPRWTLLVATHPLVCKQDRSHPLTNPHDWILFANRRHVDDRGPKTMEHHHQPMRSIDFRRTGGLNFSKTDMTEVLKPWIIINLRSIDFPRTGGLNFSKTEKSDTGWHPTCIMVSLPPNLVQRNQMNIFLGQQVALATAINFLGT